MIIQRLSQSILVFISMSHYTVNTYANDINIGIEDAYIYASNTISENTTAYLHIINFSRNNTVQLTQASSDIATEIALPSTIDLEIEAASGLNLLTKDAFLTVKGIKKIIKVGDVIPMLLTFAHGDSYLIDVIAVTPGTHIHNGEDGQGIAHDNHY